MKNIILILVVFLFVTSDSNCGIPRIVHELKLFGAYEDTIPHPELDEYVIAKICSLRVLESVEKFDIQINVGKVASFRELPDLKLYLLHGTSFYPDNYHCLLFNTSDSTIYPFDTGGPRFSRVISKYLPKIIEENKILDLINLYINTLSGNIPYYVVSDLEDYKVLWEENIKYNEGIFPSEVENIRKLAEKDIEEVKGGLYGTLMYETNTDNGSYYNVLLKTWEKSSGTIESWGFGISDRVFEVRTRSPILLEKGPCIKNKRKF